jgi:hypothetical protein
MIEKNYQTEYKRVFRIDEECYLIYTGQEKDDYKPFLRIGTTKNLPIRLFPFLQTIILTELLPGNPLQDLVDVKNDYVNEYIYLGGSTILPHYRKFLKINHIEGPKTINYNKVANREKQSMVYFLNDGNVQVLFKDILILDLKDKVNKDHHYITKTIDLKTELTKKSVRYTSKEFQNAGFFQLQGMTILYSSGKFLVFDLCPNYYELFIRYGLDPDLIDAVVMSDPNEALVRLLKRVQYIETDLQIFCFEKESIEVLTDLFLIQANKQPNIQIKSFKSEKVSNFENFKIAIEGNHYLVDHTLLSYSITVPIDANDKNSIIKPSSKPYIDLSTENSRFIELDGTINRIKFCDGMPQRVQKTKRTSKDMYNEFLVLPLSFYREIVQPAEYQLLTAVLDQIQIILAGKMRKDQYSVYKKLLKNLCSIGNEYINAFLGNLCVILRFHKTSESPVSHTYKALLDKMINISERFIAPTISIPQFSGLTAYLFLIEGKVLRLYKPIRTVSPKEYGSIIEWDLPKSSSIKDNQSQEIFQKERKRLDMLLDWIMGKEDAVSDEIVLEHKSDKGSAPAKTLPPMDKISEKSIKIEKTPIFSQKQTQIKSTPVTSKVTGEKKKIRNIRKSVLLPAFILLGFLIIFLLIRFSSINITAPFRGEKPSDIPSDIANSQDKNEDYKDPIPDESAPDRNHNSSLPDPSENTIQPATVIEDQTLPSSNIEAPIEDLEGDISEESGQVLIDEPRPEKQLATQKELQAESDSRVQSSVQPKNGAMVSAQEADPSVTSGETSTTPSKANEVDHTTVPQKENQPVEQLMEATEFIYADIPDYSLEELTIDDIVITVPDIRKIGNKIALDNGYREIDRDDLPGRNPHWIYPGTAFILPDGTDYIINRGDTVWDLAISYIKRHLRDDLNTFSKIIRIPDDSNLEALHKLQEKSVAVNFTRKVDLEIMNMKKNN